MSFSLLGEPQKKVYASPKAIEFSGFLPSTKKGGGLAGKPKNNILKILSNIFF